MASLKRKIITFGNYYNNFITQQTELVKNKIKHGLLMLETLPMLPSNYVKYVTENIYELRIKINNSIFRIFFIFDNNNIVVLFNGFQKKTQKTPKNEIEKAIKIKKEYYDSKK